jgi:hypothetical protein
VCRENALRDVPTKELFILAAQTSYIDYRTAQRSYIEFLPLPWGLPSFGLIQKKQKIKTGPKAIPSDRCAPAGSAAKADYTRGLRLSLRPRSGFAKRAALTECPKLKFGA